MSGHYRMFRGWMDNPVFGSEPFTRAQAWEWMISEAAWKDREITVKFEAVQLKRGQLCKSVRTLATEWRWDVAKVFRFLSRLETEKMITTDTESGMKRITICNYDVYQVDGNGDETPSETPMKQQRNTDETSYKKDKKDNNKYPLLSPDETPESDFKEFYAAYPLKKDPGSAARAYRKARKKATHPELMAGAHAYRAECQRKGTEKTYIKHPATWLNAEAWLNVDQTFPAPLDDVSQQEMRLKNYRTTGLWMPSWGPRPEISEQEAA